MEGMMVKKQVHVRQVQKTGNLLRSFLIWAGIAITILTVAFLMGDVISDRVALYMMAVVLVAFGISLVDFDVDDDD
ncbi:hypothetical protein B7Z00_02540 [Candidatus Saccharibacteria bacterium 32-50-10]|nr:MAG: hypothetical protein B7Z00_02540 [Candidatus Saccharibacteria bacterium 32-50-10]